MSHTPLALGGFAIAMVSSLNGFYPQPQALFSGSFGGVSPFVASSPLGGSIPGFNNNTSNGGFYGLSPISNPNYPPILGPNINPGLFSTNVGFLPQPLPINLNPQTVSPVQPILRTIGSPMQSGGLAPGFDNSLASLSGLGLNGLGLNGLGLNGLGLNGLGLNGFGGNGTSFQPGALLPSPNQFLTNVMPQYPLGSIDTAAEFSQLPAAVSTYLNDTLLLAGVQPEALPKIQSSPAILPPVFSSAYFA